MCSNKVFAKVNIVLTNGNVIFANISIKRSNKGSINSKKNSCIICKIGLTMARMELSNNPANVNLLVLSPTIEPPPKIWCVIL